MIPQMPPMPVYYSPTNCEILTTNFSGESFFGSSPMSWYAIIEEEKWRGVGSLDNSLDELDIKKQAKILQFEEPSTSTLVDANLALNILRSSSATVIHVGPTDDGGILLEFTYHDVFHMLDIYNDGEAFFVRDGANKVIEQISRNFKDELAQRLV